MLRVVVIILLVHIKVGIFGDTSHLDRHETELMNPNERSPLSIKQDSKPCLELVLDNSKKDAFESHNFKKPRNERPRKKKGKLTRPKNKAIRNNEIRQVDRNSEKDMLVRNKTMEILKNGVKILSANGDHPSGGGKSPSGVNETLLEKILSSGASKPDVLVSPSGTYKLAIGGNIYKPKELNLTSEKLESTSWTEHSDKTNSLHDQNFDYDFDYDGVLDVKDQKNRNDISNTFESSYSFGRSYESVSVDNSVKNILQQIITTLQNLTHYKKDTGCPTANSSVSDPCEKWLACKNHLEQAFVGRGVLPSCPCHYPSTIFYNDGIWDHNQKRYFRWRDASNEAERLDVYKPGAVYCIRSLLAHTGPSISSQQCCYDG